jgi:hypothetical protein
MYEVVLLGHSSVLLHPECLQPLEQFRVDRSIRLCRLIGTHDGTKLCFLEVVETQRVFKWQLEVQLEAGAP